jgi:glutathione S-transferase
MDATTYALLNMIQPTSNPADRKSIAFALRLARVEGPEVYAQVLAYARARRAEWLRWLTLTQREWQSSVSRRPARGRHHDSWAIRESWVRR